MLGRYGWPMGRALLTILPILISLGLTIYAVADIINTDEDRVRGLPKMFWILIAILITPLGPLLWIIVGKERPARGTQYHRRPVAPDDDQAFLRQLDREIDREERLRLLEEKFQELDDDPRDDSGR